MHKANQTVLEIDFNALKANFNYLKAQIGSQVKFMAVVKAFAYGADAQQISNYLQNLEVDYFAVAYTNEGVALRKAGITTPILVLHPQPVNFELLIQYCLEPSLYNTVVLDEFINIATKNKQQNYPVHIKFNTGLNRLGFNSDKVEAVCSIVNRSSCIKVLSLFSHLAASEDVNEIEFTTQQIEIFKTIAAKYNRLTGTQPWLHLCNTSGILNYPNAHFDMVRSGIGLYGYGNSVAKQSNFTPIATLKTIISQIHVVNKGQTVGYNRAYKAITNQKIAILPIGHADGISRLYGNENGFVYINNQKAPIVGNVCMDIIMVNVTKVNCNVGDEVVVFDAQFNANTLAESVGTISYELLTSISQRIKRVIKD